MMIIPTHDHASSLPAHADATPAGRSLIAQSSARAAEGRAAACRRMQTRVAPVLRTGRPAPGAGCRRSRGGVVSSVDSKRRQGGTDGADCSFEAALGSASSASARSHPRSSAMGPAWDRSVRSRAVQSGSKRHRAGIPREPDRLYRAGFGSTGGGGGIRTLGAGVTHTTVFETAPFNHSGTPPRALQGAARQGIGRAAARQRRGRRALKNARRSSAHSGASRPPATSGRWLRRGSASTSSTLPAAPAFGSAVP